MLLSLELLSYFLIFGSYITLAYPKRSTTSQKKSMSHQKLKILCLHGLGQNNQTFRNKTGSMRKRLKSLAEFTYIDSPYSITNSNIANLEDVAEFGERSWFHPQDNRYSENIVTGFNESFAYIEEAIKSKGPFDGILGFSQGAEILGLICCLKSKSLFQGDFKFAIFVSGFKSHCPAYNNHYCLPNPIKIPSLHVWGEGDNIIVKDRSEAFMELFDNSTSHKIVHPGGHFLPGHVEVAAEFKKFLTIQQQS
uniref:Ovarian cancer-associated gene 2 protein homolog n=1 Tax=Cacopsylla melanoneura TaxID=428564 RepID=A0A8D8UK22_9HEMI